MRPARAGMTALVPMVSARSEGISICPVDNQTELRRSRPSFSQGPGWHAVAALAAVMCRGQLHRSAGAWDWMLKPSPLHPQARSASLPGVPDRAVPAARRINLDRPVVSYQTRPDAPVAPFGLPEAYISARPLLSSFGLSDRNQRLRVLQGNYVGLKQPAPRFLPPRRG